MTTENKVVGLDSSTTPAPAPASASDAVVEVNVGGKVFTTLRSTLTVPENFFSGLLSGKIGTTTDKDGRPFVDRDVTLFAHLFDILRYATTWNPARAGLDHRVLSKLLDEARFYQMTDAINLLEGFAGKDDHDAISELFISKYHTQEERQQLIRHVESYGFKLRFARNVVWDGDALHIFSSRNPHTDWECDLDWYFRARHLDKYRRTGSDGWGKKD